MSPRPRSETANRRRSGWLVRPQQSLNLATTLTSGFHLRMRMLIWELKCDDGGGRAEEVIAAEIGCSGSPCDPFGRDQIAGRDGFLDGFVDQLFLTLAQVLARDTVTRRILGGVVRVNLPGQALLVSGVRHGSVLRLRPQRGCCAGCWPLGLTGAPTIRPEPPLVHDHVLEDE